MSLKQQITEDMKHALRAKDTARLGVIRLLLAAIKQREVDERIELSDADVLAVIDKMVRQRRDAIEQYKAANRHDLVEAEEFEISVLQAYLPRQMSADEINAAVMQAISASAATSVRDMGKVMAILKPQLAGRADLGKVSELVKAQLSK